MKCGRIRQDGRDGFADFCLQDGRGRLKVKQAFRRPLFYRLRGTKANSGLPLFQVDGEQAAQCVAQADFVGLHESGAADSAFKNAACAEILPRLPQDLPPHDAVQNVQLQRRYGRMISRHSFQIRVWTGAMVGYVYNLGTKKRNKCLLDNKVQTNSRQNKASIPFLH